MAIGEKFLITKKGISRLIEELDNLINIERPGVIESIAKARDLGDLSENAEYHSAREKQSLIEGRISLLEDRKAKAEVIDQSLITSSRVSFGAIVALNQLDNNKQYRYEIVGEYEAEINLPSKETKISIRSPLARAVIGKQIGDFITVYAPLGEIEYELTELYYPKD